ncbi:hypothetical protein BVZ90_01391B, partial [Haemophilus influenzae]
ISKLI